jgi:hypothetical protein
MLLAICSVATGCRGPALVRPTSAAVPVVSASFAGSLAAVRGRILGRFGTSRAALPEPFNRMTAGALTAPQFPSDWLVTVVDPGGFLASYKRLSAADRQHDVLIQDQTGDLYWPSEYATAEGPVKFRCGFILHFRDQQDRSTVATGIEIYELVPTVWVGEHWAMSAHGIGFGRYHDIRFVEPTTKDRKDVLNLIEQIVAR